MEKEMRNQTFNYLTSLDCPSGNTLLGASKTFTTMRCKLKYFDFLSSFFASAPEREERKKYSKNKRTNSMGSPLIWSARTRKSSSSPYHPLMSRSILISGPLLSNGLRAALGNEESKRAA
ncbi:hypothetical protein TNCV_3358641 [Trichonephila clavipes]|nr:hypothetical protein TNCV_3358641 [Trichonephila clavipes]